MNAVLVSPVSRSGNPARVRWPAAVPLLLCCAASSLAMELPDDQRQPATMSLAPSESDASRERGLSRMEVSASSLPRFDSADGSTHSSRLDLTWLPPRRSALGLAIGMTSLHGSMLPAAAAPFAGNSTSVDLGLHWRYTLESNERLDVMAWRRVVPPDALSLVQSREPSYGARVEMRIGPVLKTGFVADRGFLGFQLESGARITLRRSGGKPMVYYRTKF